MNFLKHYIMVSALLIHLNSAEATMNFTSKLVLAAPEDSVFVCVKDDLEEPRLQLHLYLSGYDGVLDYFGGGATLHGETLTPGPHILTYVHGITDRTHDVKITLDEEDVLFSKPNDRKMWYTSFQYKFVEFQTGGAAEVAVLEGESTMSVGDLESLCPTPPDTTTAAPATTIDRESPSSSTPMEHDESSPEAPIETLPPSVPMTPTKLTTPTAPSTSTSPATSTAPSRPTEPAVPKTSIMSTLPKTPRPPTTPIPPTTHIPPASVSSTALPSPSTSSPSATQPRPQGSTTSGQSWLKYEVIVVLCVLAGLVVLCCGFTFFVCACCKRGTNASPHKSRKTPKKTAKETEYQKVPMDKV